MKIFNEFFIFNCEIKAKVCFYLQKYFLFIQGSLLLRFNFQMEINQIEDLFESEVLIIRIGSDFFAETIIYEAPKNIFFSYR